MELLGIDIGGTGIKGAMVETESGEQKGDRFRIPTPSPPLPDKIADVVGEIAAHFSYQGPMGVTFPGVVRNGTIGTAVNLDPAWVGIDGEKLFSSKVGGNVSLINDADAAGIAEMRFGAGKGRRGVTIMVTLGTGIGTAVFINEQLVPNTEFGHLQIRGKDAEHRASERAREKKGLDWKQWAEHVAEFLLALDKLMSPDLFIIGGGVSRKADKFVPHLEEHVKVPIQPAVMQNAAGIIGAACHESTRSR